MNKYTDLNTFIGSGAFGTCHLYERNDNQANVVIKKIPMTGGSIDTLIKEVELLHELHHPFIVRFIEAFTAYGCLCIATYFADGGTLATLIKECDDSNRILERERILLYFTQITMAIDYLHSKLVAHRDLKPENIFLNSKKTIVKVADFGISKSLKHGSDCSNLTIGTWSYIAPETISGMGRSASKNDSFVSRRQLKLTQGADSTIGSQSLNQTKDSRFEIGYFDLKCDLWALGCVLYELIELRKAFPIKDELEVAKKISKCKYVPRRMKGNNDIFAIVKELLIPEADSRLATSEILLRPVILSMVMTITTRPLTLDLSLYKKKKSEVDR